jgi:hypothetical protein
MKSPFGLFALTLTFTAAICLYLFVAAITFSYISGPRQAGAGGVGFN